MRRPSRALSLVNITSLAILGLCILRSAALPTALRQRASGPARLIQYVQTFHIARNQSDYVSLLPLLEGKTSVTHVILAALHVNEPAGHVTLNDDPPDAPLYDELWSEARTLQQNGVKVLVMLGGAARGTYNGRLCRSGDGGVDDAYYEPLRAFIETFGIDGVDLDIEETVPLACPVGLVQRLKADLGNDFLVTLAPVASDLTPAMRGLGGFSYKALHGSAAGPLVDWYNTQYYSGFVEGSIEDSHAAAVGNGFAASRVVVGVLDNADNGAGFLPLPDLRAVVANLKRASPDFAGVDGWEYFNSGRSDGLPDRHQWLREVGYAVFGSPASGSVALRKHVPPLSEEVVDMMRGGLGQIEAATAIRFARGRWA